MSIYENDIRILSARAPSRIDSVHSPIAPTVVDQEPSLHVVDSGQESDAYVEDLFHPQSILGRTVSSESQLVAGVGMEMDDLDDLDDLFGTQAVYEVTGAQTIPDSNSMMSVSGYLPSDILQVADSTVSYTQVPRHDKVDAVGSLTVVQADTRQYDSQPHFRPPDVQEAPISLRGQMIQHMTDNVARIMQTYSSALEAHMLSCNGSDGHPVFNPRQMSGEPWIKAYDGTQTAIQRAIESDIDLKTAVQKGALSADQEAKLQKLALKVYGDALGTDTSKLQAMTSELMLMSDPAMAMSMMQGALSHVGCACHPTQLTSMAPTLFGPAPNTREHTHKHQKILCKTCGWTGVQCESESCPRCRKKQWVVGQEAIKKFLKAAKHN